MRCGLPEGRTAAGKCPADVSKFCTDDFETDPISVPILSVRACRSELHHDGLRFRRIWLECGVVVVSPAGKFHDISNLTVCRRRFDDVQAFGVEEERMVAERSLELRRRVWRFGMTRPSICC